MDSESCIQTRMILVDSLGWKGTEILIGRWTGSDLMELIADILNEQLQKLLNDFQSAIKIIKNIKNLEVYTTR